MERQSSHHWWKVDEGDGGEAEPWVGRWGERAENNDVDEETLSVCCVYFNQIGQFVFRPVFLEWPFTSSSSKKHNLF